MNVRMENMIEIFCFGNLKYVCNMLSGLLLRRCVLSQNEKIGQRMLSQFAHLLNKLTPGAASHLVFESMKQIACFSVCTELDKL